jgi:lipopolysaccharide/colanic/teichoic acid biosynthesis glycosyltransferase
MSECIHHWLKGRQKVRKTRIDRARNERLPEAIYRIFDAVCAAGGLMVLTPVLLAVAVLVLWDDGPPVFFSQMRVGRRGKLFRIWKFRTMRAGAKGSAITAASDGRITRVGAALRRCKLDELPQLFNVLKGDMSLVGPRPEAPEFVQLEAPIWQAVLQVRPGVTDLSSLLYRDEEKLLATSSDPSALYRKTVLPAKLVLSLGRLRSRSFWRDLKLIYLTIRYSLFPERFDPDLVKRTVGIGLSR